MTRIFLVIFLVFCAGFASQASATSENLMMSYQDTQDVYFSNKSIHDKLHIVVTGACTESRVWVAIETLHGETLHASSIRGKRLFSDHGDCIEPHNIVEALFQPLQDFVLPDVEEINSQADLSLHNIDRDAIAAARLQDRPLLCLKGGKSFSDCFAFIDGKTILLFSSGS